MSKKKSQKTSQKKLLNNDFDNNIDNFLLKKSYLTGLVGLFTLVLCAYSTHKKNIVLDHDFIMHQFYNILIIGFSMCLSEFALQIYFKLKNNNKLITLPDFQFSQFLKFLIQEFISINIIFYIFYYFYKQFPAYDYLNESGFYYSFFFWFDYISQYFYLLSLMYLVPTVFYFNLKKNESPYFDLIKNLILLLFSILALEKSNYEIVTKENKILLRGLLVKFFFIPIMSVFFITQMKHFVLNIGYLLEHFSFKSITNLKQFNSDFLNISQTILFSIDVCIGLCGYLFSSKWLRNNNISVEPTMLGWVVTLLCYPPIRDIYGKYFVTPSEKSFMNFQTDSIVTFFAILSMLSLVIYTSATIAFGIRFSNLTYRGVIQNGPYAIVRHPAYASKNFSWWLVIFPFIIYSSVTHNFFNAIFSLLSLIMITTLYYLRAITEERHLMQFPEYQEYASKVKYRFFPKIF